MTPDIEENKFKALFNNISQNGTVKWLGTREKDSRNIQTPDEVEVEKGGIKNDKSNKGYIKGKRHVTLIQAEHLNAVASFLGLETLDPKLLRRNIVVSGINLNALKNKQFKIGEAIFEMTGFCYPCSKMEKNLGPGGFNAMRGHGGITCRVIEPGLIKIGDALAVENIFEV